MNPTLRLLLLLALAAAPRAGAALESAQLNPDNVLPTFPGGLQLQGITRGEVVVAVSVNTEGRVADFLVLGYTQESLARRCREALPEWRFTPARLDGVPVPTQLTLQVSFTLEGAVVSGNGLNHFFFDHLDSWGDGRLSYRLHHAGEIDRVPARVSTVTPKYAREAEQQGVRGKVRVNFYIDEEGRVRLPSVDSAPQPYLAEKAVAAVREWRFAPPTSLGEPVLVAASQEFDFSAAGGK